MFRNKNMSDKGKLLVLLTLSIMIGTLCYGQKNINRSVSQDISESAAGLDNSGQSGSEYIPSLETLIKYAIENSPLISQQNSLINVQNVQLQSKKLSWTDYIKPFAEIKYGSTDYVYIGSNQGGVVTGDVMTTTRYSIGARLDLSAFDLVDQKKRVLVETYKLDAINGRLDEIKQQIRLTITKSFYDLFSYQRILKDKTDYLVTQLTSLDWIEEQFRKAEISYPEVARVRQILKEARDEKEIAFRNYQNEYMRLQELVGVNFNTLKGRQ